MNMKKKIVAMVLVGVMACGLWACGGSGESYNNSTNQDKSEEKVNKESEEKKAAEEAAKKQAEEEKKALESYTKKPVADFMVKVQELGYTAEYIDDGVDFTEIIPDMQSDYSVETAKVDTDKKTVSVELISNSVLQARQMTENLEAKLPASNCWVAAENYGESQYPYGFELHYLMGKIAEEAKDENTWFLKAECTVTNMFGAEVNGTCEALVTGTKDSPKITSFNVY